MRVLVTGGSGYIGSRLLGALAADADVEEIIDVDLRPPRVAIPKVRYESRSVSDDLRELFTDKRRPIDVAMHLAWSLDPLRDAGRQREICIGGTQRVLDACVAGNVKHVLFMSSATAYGAHPAHNTPVDESEPLKAEYHFQYSAEKREAEGLCHRFATDRPDTLLQIVRPTVVGGPNVSNYIFRAMDKPLNFRAIGLDPEIQLVHEDDAAGALVAIVRSKLPGAFNLTGDGTMRLSAAYHRIGARVIPLPMSAMFAVADLAWKRGWSHVIEAPAAASYFVAYPWLISNRRLKNEVGFQPAYTTQETLETFLVAKGR